jgi:hypothetical protein
VLPLKKFSSPATGARILGGLQDAKLIHCVDPDSWKPLDNDVSNAKARRFLPNSELLLANVGPDSVASAPDYHTGNWQARQVRSTSNYIPADNCPMTLPSHVTGALNAGTGLIFDWNRAIPILSAEEEPKRSHLLQSACMAVGYGGGHAVLHTVWEQKESGRICSSNPSIINLPRKLRPALVAPFGGIVAEVDFSNFESRVAHELAGVTPPDGDFAEILADRLGVNKSDVKPILNAMLHGQTPGNLVGKKDYRAFELRREIDLLLRTDHPALLRTIAKLGKNSNYLQSRGAQVFIPTFAEALSREHLPAGIPLHDGWVFPANDENQVNRVKELFERKGAQILGFPTPVKSKILSLGL